MQYIKNGHLIINTGIREDPTDNPMHKLEAKSDSFEYLVKINVDILCDFCDQPATESLEDLSFCNNHWNEACAKAEMQGELQEESNDYAD